MSEFDPTPRRALRKADVPPAEPTPNPLAVRKGSTSADTVKKPKKVSVKVTIPKDVRTRLKAEAEALGISVDDLIARRLS